MKKKYYILVLTFFCLLAGHSSYAFGTGDGDDDEICPLCINLDEVEVINDYHPPCFSCDCDPFFCPGGNPDNNTPPEDPTPPDNGDPTGFQDDTNGTCFLICGNYLLLDETKCECTKLPRLWYLDKDGDGWHSDTQLAEDSPGDLWRKTTKGEDCDDDNPDVTTNCYKTYYIDNDGDGWDGGTISAKDDNGGLYKNTTKGKDCDDGVFSVSNICSNCIEKISKVKLLEAASKLNIKAEHILAVYIVESEGNAFRDNGDPKILFERHYFSALTNGKYDVSNPDISNPVQGGYGLFSEQLEKLERAYALDPEAAIRSASFGAFQIMGKNYGMCGYTDVAKFHNDMTSGNLDLHLNAFTNYVITNNLQDELRNNQWAVFASKYNGKAYKKNKYDTNMAKAYQKLIDNINLMLKDCF